MKTAIGSTLPALSILMIAGVAGGFVPGPPMEPQAASATGPATTYFVKTTGNNSNTGLSDTQAWAFAPGMAGCTATCASTTINPGDTIEFNMGDIWRDTLTPAVSGTQSNPINYTAYGSGPLPVIAGSDLLTSWTPAGSAYYSTSASVKPGNVIVDGKNRMTQNSASITSLSPGQWSWDSGSNRMYVRLADDSDPNGHVMEGTQRQFAIHNTRNWLTFANLITYGTTRSGYLENGSNTLITSVSATWNDGNGFLLRGGFVTCASCTATNNLVYGIATDTGSSGSHDITLTNSQTQNNVGNGIEITGTTNVTIIGGDSSSNGTSTVEGNGISVTSIGGVNATNISVTNFNAHDNLGNGISVIGADPGSGSVNVTVTGGSYCHNLAGVDPASGVRFDQNTNNSTIQYVTACNNQSGGIVNEVGANNNKILYNIVYGNHDGLCQSNGTGINVVWYGNVSYNNTEWGFAHVGGSAGATVKNNILMNNAVAGYYNDGAGGIDTPDYNLVFGNVTDYSGISKPAHDVNADPLFLNAGGNDFRLQAGSPAIYAGANLGKPYNLALNPITTPPYGTFDQNSAGPGWTIGAFVYVSQKSATPQAPTGLAAVVQ